MTGETRSWRRLALAGAGAVALLTVRVLTRPRPEAAMGRRLAAIEGHLAELDRRVNALNIWGGQHWHRDPSAKPEFTPGDAYNRLADIAGDDDGG